MRFSGMLVLQKTSSDLKMKAGGLSGMLVPGLTNNTAQHPTVVGPQTSVFPNSVDLFFKAVHFVHF